MNPYVKDYMNMQTKSDYESVFNIMKKLHKVTQQLNKKEENIINIDSNRYEVNLSHDNCYVELPLPNIDYLSVKIKNDWSQIKNSNVTINIGTNKIVKILISGDIDTLTIIDDNNNPCDHRILIDTFTLCGIKNLIIDCKGKVKNLRLKDGVKNVYLKSKCYSVFNTNRDSSCSSILYSNHPITWLQHQHFTNVCHDRFIKDKVKYMVNSAYGENNYLLIDDSYIIPSDPDEMVIKLKREGDISSLGELFGYLDGFLNHGQNLEFKRNTRIKMGLSNFHIGKRTNIIQDTYQETLMTIEDFENIFDILKLHVEKYI